MKNEGANRGAAAPTATSPAKALRQQVYERLRSAIEQGTLAPGARLPPSREQAQMLNVARNTVLWAIERLRAEGYLVARVGDGTYVAAGIAALRPASRGRAAPVVLAGSLSKRGQLIADTALRWRPPTAPAIPLRIGTPAIDQFPFAVWERLERQTSAAMRRSSSHYQDPAGHLPLREAVAHWLLLSRGIRCEAAQVVITAGSQQAIDLIGRLLLDAGDEVLVEDPGYPGIRACLVGHGALARPVPLDDEGMVIADAAATWPDARMAVVTPTHQFPLGVRMSLARRLALLDWAREHKAWIVEDDYDGEFQYGAHRIPALCSLPHAQRVLYVGTFSKTLHPGLRLGFIVLPSALAGAFASAKALADRHGPAALQDVLARFITDGHLFRHLRRMRELYPARQALLIAALTRASGGALQLAPSVQGLHLCHEVTGRRGSDAAFSARAAEAGVFLAPLSAYAIESRRQGLLFGFAGYDDAALTLAARRIGAIFKDR